MGYIYKQTERGEYPLWTVGTYDGGEWNADSDHNIKEEAAERARYLNGGNTLTPLQKAAPDLFEVLQNLVAINVKVIHGVPIIDARNKKERALYMQAFEIIKKTKGQ